MVHLYNIKNIYNDLIGESGVKIWFYIGAPIEKTTFDPVEKKIIKKEVYPANYIVIEDRELFNMILDGNKQEETQFRLLKERLKAYDESTFVNSFTLNNKSIWISREERGDLERRFRVEKAAGITETTLWRNGIAFTLSPDQGLAMLDAIELYAIKCYDNTQKHLAAIKELKTIEEIQNYDYTTGYPEKLKF